MMRPYVKYFVILIFIYGCGENTRQDNNERQSLYSEPVIIPLNVSGGYKINQFTGDSIKPLINSLGDTVQTGIPTFLVPSNTANEKRRKPNISKLVILSKVPVSTNKYLAPDKAELISGDTVGFQSIKPTQINQPLDLRNSEDILNIGTTIPVTSKKMIMHEPQPAKALPLRFKDAATSNIQYLDVGQGLGYSFVHSLIADRHGYLWFGLDGNGLCKYDGVSMINYTQKEGLPDNNVTSLVEDSTGNIWIGTNNGLCMFDGKNITQYSKANGFPGGPINTMYKDEKENVWINGGDFGYIRYDGKKFILFDGGKKFTKNIFYPFFEDSRGAVWIRINSGLAKFDGKQFISFPIFKSKGDISTCKMIEASNGDLWVASVWEGIFKYNGNFFTRYAGKEGLSGNSIRTLQEDKKGNIWIGTAIDGINKFNGGKFTNYSIDQGLTINSISGIVEDIAGNIWCSTFGGGINKLNDEGFSEIVKLSDVGNSRVRPIVKDIEGNLWFGTEAGRLFKYDGKNIVSYTNTGTLPSHGLRSIMQDKKGDMWFGYTDGGGLFKYDKKNLFHFTKASGIRGENIMSLLEDKDGIIWLGTFDDGISRLEGETFTYYSENEKFPGKNVYTILQDKKGNLWFGTKGSGVVKYDGNSFITFSEKEGLYGKGVTSIIEDETGNLWFGTLGAGLCKFDGRSFTYFTDKQGLSFNDIWSLKEDSLKEIWAGTDKGLSVLIPREDSLQKNKKNYAIYSFGLQDGLKGTDFNLHSVCIDNNNRIWWGTGKSLVTRDLKKPFREYEPRSLKLNYIEINEHFYDYRHIVDSIKEKISFSNVTPFSNNPGGLDLSYDQNHLTFHFSAIDWSAPHKIKYSYRLIGLDAEWSIASETPVADYRNLSYGRYELLVTAIGQSQKWTEPISYKFVIRPAWWQTWWFKTSIVLFAILISIYISWLIYLYRLRKQRMLLEKQIAIQNERQRISSEMHDDIGAGLSSVRLLTEMTRNKLKEYGATNEIDNIYQSVGDISVKMQEVIWSLNAENDHLNNLVYFIQKQVRSLLEHYPCKLSFELPSFIPNIELRGEIRRNIYLVVKEAVHNIIKHSGANKVKLTITFEEKLVIIVSDNGKGMNTENYNAGNGLKNMQQRMKQLNGKILIKNEEGLSLLFEIPVKSFL